MQKILITGGLGQVGSYLVDKLCNTAEVTVLDNYSSTTRESVPDGVTIVNDDILNKRARELVTQNDVVIHTAAQISVFRSMDDPLFDLNNNVFGTLNLLEAARSSNVNLNKFIYFSSAAVYGNPEYLPIDEAHPQNPLSPYGASKLSGEKYCTMYHKAFGVPTVCIRPFNIYSPRQDPSNPYSGVISKFIERVKNNQSPIIFGDGTNTRDFVSVHDIIDMVLLAIDNKKAEGEVFNVGTGVTTTITELAQNIIDIYGADLDIEFAERMPGDIKHSSSDISKARLIGFKPKIKLRDGLGEFLNTQISI
ncbi:MAG TPA: NAD-dependent epimerase/dehydratase family protein [Methanosarcinaceae archaeon]|nr:NAD-dependent epimerase/dehydratase family protein [Methanosarcinaceae archaeon]